ncbi:MAG: hypothetical protein ACKVT2_06475 [Saprospiraceae bacterium]
MKKSLFFFLVLFASVFAFESCRKNDNNDALVATAEDLAANEDYIEQLDLDADVAVEERGGGPCPTVTFAQPEGTWPNTITIDYGTACTRPDGRVLSGILIINQTADIRTPGAVRTITHDNFFVDGVQVEGTRSWTNNGQNVDGQWSYTKVATDMKLTFEDGSVTTWSKTRNSTLIEGGNTLTHWDDVWSSTGTASGTNRNGIDFTATVLEPLVKRASCRWISSGVLEFTVGLRTRSLDFGDGNCDRFGTLTLANGESYSIRLRR